MECAVKTGCGGLRLVCVPTHTGFVFVWFFIWEKNVVKISTTTHPPPPNHFIPIAETLGENLLCVTKKYVFSLCYRPWIASRAPFSPRPALMVYDLHFIAIHWTRREVVWTSRMTRAKSSKQEVSIFQLILQSLHCQKSKAKYDLKFIQAKNINMSTLSLSSLPLSQDPSWPGSLYFMFNLIWIANYYLFLFPLPTFNLVIYFHKVLIFLSSLYPWIFHL